MKEYTFSTKELLDPSAIWNSSFQWNAIKDAGELYKNLYLHSVNYEYDQKTLEHKWIVKMVSPDELK